MAILKAIFFSQPLEMTRLVPPVNPLATHYIAGCQVGSQANNAPQHRTVETQRPEVSTVERIGLRLQPSAVPANFTPVATTSLSSPTMESAYMCASMNTHILSHTHTYDCGTQRHKQGIFFSY